MANDRLFLACTTCRTRGPMLGAWWVSRFTVNPSEREEFASDVGAFVGEHLLSCRPEGIDTAAISHPHGASWVALVDEATAYAMPERKHT